MSNVWENNILLVKADWLVHNIYRVVRNFPANERFGITSQICRASLSIVLNIIEGYSRFGQKEHIRFLEISFGSAKETHYLIEFCFQEKLVKKDDYDILLGLINEVEKMLYSKLKTLRGKS
ncbi:four helix bundle protein [Candidatus Collierbacteria bacterium]|nr:four helix bundle protein [Candidatus Collierbacteria bacterium]